MQTINETLLAVFNASASPPAMLVALAQLLADWLIYVVAVALVWGWLRSRAAGRVRLVTVGLTIIIALVVAVAIATAWYHPRPFAVDAGHQWLAHTADSSFPSDHATVLFAVAFGLIAARAPAHWSALVFLSAIGVAWSRVYLGVHWPLDMVGSFLVALGASLLACAAVATKPVQSLRGWFLAVQDRVLDTLHIPASVVRRSFSAK